MNYRKLPIYKHRKKILDAVASHQVTIIESSPGSGKTTVLPILLYEAGYTDNGCLGITQPRRIAAVNVSQYIQSILPEEGLVAYKMRFDDQATPSTKIKLVTDGTLLQEIKTDPWLERYSVIVVDEAHERSLNIDFLLGILKRILAKRPDFKVIISSATLNTQNFSDYFFNAPIITIETAIYPVQVIYNPPKEHNMFSHIDCIEDILCYGVDNKSIKNVLIFLPGEAYIIETFKQLSAQPLLKKCEILFLYGKLTREEQQAVFKPVAKGKIKVVLATNIAETSITIDGVDTVIDTGLAKLNYHNPLTFTSALEEVNISKASADQRKGRAGRTNKGVCYRLYSQDSFASRDNYTHEEIHRTDLTEVILRMADLDLHNFNDFDFITKPSRKGIQSAVQTLHYLGALNEKEHLTTTGDFMAKLPLSPRHSRIIWEGIQRYPEVLNEILIIVAFLSTHSPFVLPSEELMEAREKHKGFASPWGDFVAYLNMFKAFTSAKNQSSFCERNYLDFRSMNELVNIVEQLQQILSEMNIPILKGGPIEDALKACAVGLVQFICKREGRCYRSLTAERIIIHPGSNLFKEKPEYMVAGEIVKTSQMYARSVSVLKEKWLLNEMSDEIARFARSSSSSSRKDNNKQKSTTPRNINASENKLHIGSASFLITQVKSKKSVSFDLATLQKALKPFSTIDEVPMFKNLHGSLVSQKAGKTITLLAYNKVDEIIRYAYFTRTKKWIYSQLPKQRFHSYNEGEIKTLIEHLPMVMKLLKKNKTISYIALHTDGQEAFWLAPQHNFQLAAYTSIEAFEAFWEHHNHDLNEKDLASIGEIFQYLQNLYMY